MTELTTTTAVEDFLAGIEAGSVPKGVFCDEAAGHQATDLSAIGGHGGLGGDRTHDRGIMSPLL